MIPFHDCLGRLACMGNPETGLVECLYKGNKTSAVLAVGETFTVERQDIVTIITRVSFDKMLSLKQKTRYADSGIQKM